jgi:hypothetical protein
MYLSSSVVDKVIKGIYFQNNEHENKWKEIKRENEERNNGR